MDENAGQKNSPAYRLAALDPDFLLGDSCVGCGCSLNTKRQRDDSAPGSYARPSSYSGARACCREEVPMKPSLRRRCHRGRCRAPATNRRGGMKRRGASGGSRPSEGARSGRATEIRDNVIATGGGPGIMEAANRGASEAGAPSIGFNIGLPHEQEPNAYSTPDLTFQFHYFAVRKLHFAMRANALVVFPGGFGTIDELFDLLTLMQTAKMPAIPVVLVEKPYWSCVINFTTLVEEGMIAQADLDLFSYADDAEAAWHELVRRGLNRGPRPAGYPSKMT